MSWDAIEVPSLASGPGSFLATGKECWQGTASQANLKDTGSSWSEALRRRVLIVDDDAGTGRLLALLVRHHGHHADYVDSGFKALDYLSDQPADLVILDVMMPGLDGLEVLKRVRTDPKTAGVPVVMFSALCDPKYTEQAREIGANDYWVKASLDFQTLGNRLAVFLPSSQQAD